MKRVLVFGMTKNAGGVESVIMNYYRNIDRASLQFDFLCNGNDIAYYDEIISLGGKVYYITPISKNFFKYKKEMHNFFKANSNKYDSIWMNVCALSNIDYLKYAKKFGIKKRIIHSHNSQSIESKIKRIFHFFNKFFIKKYATDYWACSSAAGHYFYNNDKFLIVNNAIHLEDYSFSEKVRFDYRNKFNLHGKFVIGNVARFHFQKNHEFLIDIFNEFVKINENSVLLLVGFGEDMQKIKDKVKYLNLSDKVLFLGKRSDVANLYQCMDLFLLPSLFEGLPVVLVEAQAVGIPIVASYEGIPSTAKIVDNFYFLSLKDNPRLWAEFISNVNLTNMSKHNADLIRKAGYDIICEVGKLEKLLVIDDE